MRSVLQYLGLVLASLVINLRMFLTEPCNDLNVQKKRDGSCKLRLPSCVALTEVVLRRGWWYRLAET